MTIASVASHRRRRGPPKRPLSRLTLIRLGKNEATARPYGHEAAPSETDEPLRFQCECEGERCRETLLLTRSEYAYVRAQSGWLIVAPGHQIRNTSMQERLGNCFVLKQNS